MVLNVFNVGYTSEKEIEFINKISEGCIIVNTSPHHVVLCTHMGSDGKEVMVIDSSLELDEVMHLTKEKVIGVDLKVVVGNMTHLYELIQITKQEE